MFELYILKDKKVAIAETYQEWVNFFYSKERIIAKTSFVKGDNNIEVSTVFVCVPNIDNTLFETMIFADGDSAYRETHSTYEEAEQYHKAIVKYIENEVNGDNHIITELKRI